MKVHDWLESMYVSTNIENQLEYHPSKAAKVTAIQSLISGQKVAYKYVAYLVLAYYYIKTVLKLIPEPKTAKEIVQEFQDSKNGPKVEKEA